MRWSYHIFSIFGISIELDLSFLIFFLFIALLNPMLLLFFIILFSIVLAHELIHSITAIAYGVKVQKIRLLPIGGIASINIPEDPLKELVISIAGPAFNFVLVGIGLLIAYLLNIDLIGYGALMDGISQGTANFHATQIALSIIIYINLVLGAFNMLPAFPMDGGRVFRAVLSIWIDHRSATRIATYIGQAIFLLLMIAGVLTFNIIWIVIGLLMFLAGGSEMRMVDVKGFLGTHTLADLSIGKPPSVNRLVRWGDFFENVHTLGQMIYLVTDDRGILKKVIDISKISDFPKDSFVGDSIGLDYALIDGEGLASKNIQLILTKSIVLVTTHGRLTGFISQDTINQSLNELSIKRRIS